MLANVNVYPPKVIDNPVPVVVTVNTATLAAVNICNSCPAVVCLNQNPIENTFHAVNVNEPELHILSVAVSK